MDAFKLGTDHPNAVQDSSRAEADTAHLGGGWSIGLPRPTAIRHAFAGDLVADARAERVAPRWALRIFWTPLIGGVLVAMTFVVRPVYYGLLREDHPIEWLQFAFCLLAAVAAALAVSGLARRRRWAHAAVMAMMALGCLGLAGEEISWGQRVFGFVGSVVENNRQGELNLHNVDAEAGIPIEELFRVAEMVVGLIGALLPLLTRRQQVRLPGSFWRMVSPPLFLAPCFLTVFAYRFLRLLVPAEISALVKYQEWAEVCLYSGLATMAVLIYAGLKPSPAGTVTLDQTPASAPASAPAVLRLPDLSLIVVVAAAIALVTALFAFLSLLSGIAPGNV
jgi:hypothetical protein